MKENGGGRYASAAVLCAAPICSFVGADDSVRSNTAQRCHSEPVLTLAWESVSRARRRSILTSLCEGGVKAEGFDGGRDNDTPPLRIVNR